MSVWKKIVIRSMTEIEKENYFDYIDVITDHSYSILDCDLPDDSQEVLITVNNRVTSDIFRRNGGEGSYFEMHDISDVKAWMPYPEPYTD